MKGHSDLFRRNSCASRSTNWLIWGGLWLAAALRCSLWFRGRGRDVFLAFQPSFFSLGLLLLGLASSGLCGWHLGSIQLLHPSGHRKRQRVVGRHDTVSGKAVQQRAITGDAP